MRSVTTERRVNILQPPHEIAHLVPSVWSSGRSTEMRAASEGTRVIDDALAVWIQHRTTTRLFIRGLRKFPPARRTQTSGGYERLARGEHRSPSGQLELAALRAPHAIAFDWPLFEICINCTDVARCCVCWIISAWLHGRQ